MFSTDIPVESRNWRGTYPGFTVVNCMNDYNIAEKTNGFNFNRMFFSWKTCSKNNPARPESMVSFPITFPSQPHYPSTKILYIPKNGTLKYRPSRSTSPSEIATPYEFIPSQPIYIYIYM